MNTDITARGKRNDYKIVEAWTTEELTSKVNHLLAKGYETIGGVAVHRKPSDETHTYSQALVGQVDSSFASIMESLTEPKKTLEVYTLGLRSNVKSIHVEMPVGTVTNPLPDGQYKGTWGGYVVKAEINGNMCIFNTETGIRCIKSPCLVMIESGVATVAAIKETL